MWNDIEADSVALLRVCLAVSYRLSLLSYCNTFGLLVSEGDTDGQVFIWDTSLIISAFYGVMEEAAAELTGAVSESSGFFVTNFGSMCATVSCLQLFGLPP